jgi:hypothetical protein
MTAPNIAVEPATYSFGSALLRLRFRWRLTAGVRRRGAASYPRHPTLWRIRGFVWTPMILACIKCYRITI